ncbi:N-acetylmuramoyl-L-alanine amidase [Pseudotabrizicola sp. 4114]|uniref:N-acetylmuramoyl-L-alanine amidase n=1 Tax=Pseudotabrizicola sp. 4114 TaxID=2817731 RepID=UPI0028574BAB|nr:hypothetical protein [Pseudorhodobacter sp. 4114]
MNILQGSAKYPVTEVILHCAAIRAGQFDGYTAFAAFSAVNRWHRERGFSGFGYHGLFMPDGQFYQGRPETMIGAHCIERNRGSLGYLLIESAEIKTIGKFSDYFTEQQRQAVGLKISTLPGIKTVSGHNDYAKKLCPGFKVITKDWLK